MKFQVANGEVISATGIAHVSIRMYGFRFNLPIFICDLGDLDCIFGMDAARTAGFIICARTGKIWFNAEELGKPELLIRNSCNAICHLRAVRRLELKPFEKATIEVAYVKRAMSKCWNGSLVHCTTHPNLWSELGTIVMDGVADLSSGSADLGFDNATSNPVVIKPGQIVATAVQIDSVEALPDIEPYDDINIPSSDPIFSSTRQKNEFVYPCITSDELMEKEDDEFELDMYIIEVPISCPRLTPREEGTLIDCVQALYDRACKNLSSSERSKVKEVLVEHNETTFHDPEKPKQTL